MKTDTLLDVLGLGLRAAEAALQRRRPTSAGPDSRADRIVKRVVLPVAAKALDRAAPASTRPAARRRRRRGLPLGFVASTLAGALAAGGVAYVLLRQQQRVRERYRPLRAPFRPELLEVLSAPGGGGRLEGSGETLIDRHSGAVYSIIDGVPDFIAPASPTATLAAEDTWFQDLVRPAVMVGLGRNSAGNAALAATVAGAAGEGWMLSVPSGRGLYEIEMARANPRAHVLCLSNNWDVLLEVRRGAHAAGLDNLYFVRGAPSLLPVRDRVIGGVWSGSGLHRFLRPERELTQMVRVVRPGAPVAGLSLVRGGPPIYEVALRLGGPYLPGLRTLPAYTALLEAAGLQHVRLFRDGAFVRFTGVRG
jgi:SAM-dependent methyltransferase